MSTLKALALKTRKPPCQRHSHATRDSILEAAARTLAKNSLDRFNTHRVTEVTGISNGLLCQYFPRNEALTTALLLRSHTMQAAQSKALTLGRRPPPFQVRARPSSLPCVAKRCQSEQPTLSAARDHEARRLPVGKLLRAYLAIGKSLLDFRHGRRHTIAAADLTVVARDVIAIAKALLEKDTDGRRDPPIGLEDSIYRAVMGDLVMQPVGAALLPRRQ